MKKNNSFVKNMAQSFNTTLLICFLAGLSFFTYLNFQTSQTNSISIAKNSIEDHYAEKFGELKSSKGVIEALYRFEYLKSLEKGQMGGSAESQRNMNMKKDMVKEL